MARYGIDVSSYQGDIDWKQVKEALCQFAVLKCIRRDLEADTAFSRNLAGCAAQGIPVGCYTYVYERSVKGAEKRAKAAVQVCRAMGLTGCAIWWDLEDRSLRKIGAENRAALTKSVLAARRTVEAAGYAFGVYCDADFYTACLNADQIGGRWWLASYGPNRVTHFGKGPDRRKPVLHDHLSGWQYCSRGLVPGITGSVDLDVAYDAVFTDYKPNPEQNPYPQPDQLVTSDQRAQERGLRHWCSSGPQVRWLQWELHRLGYDLGPNGIDGLCGAKTLAAMERFQREAGLRVDGLCGPATVSALKRATAEEGIDYRARVARLARQIYPLCVGKVHGGTGVSAVNSLTALKREEAVSCNRMVSIVLQEAGCLPVGALLAHTPKAEGKRDISAAVTGYETLRHCTLHWVNRRYQELPAAYRQAGCIYVQNSNECICAGGGKIWSCNKRKGYRYRRESDYLRTGGYPFTSPILVVIVPES